MGTIAWIACITVNCKHMYAVGLCFERLQGIFLMSPFYGQPASDYVSKLSWHIQWHQALGVDRHVLYIVEQMASLIADPRVQVSNSTCRYP